MKPGSEEEVLASQGQREDEGLQPFSSRGHIWYDTSPPNSWATYHPR